MSRIIGIATVAALVCAPRVARAQSLKGSPESVDLMYDEAVSHSLTFFHTASQVRAALATGALVAIQPTNTLAVAGASFPIALPGTRDFVERLSAEYANACGDAMIVTSAARPLALHLRNSVPKTVHPTGMAVDIRKPRDRECLAWMRAELLSLEGRHAIEATEEFHPPHFHIAVLPGWESHMPDDQQIASGGDVEPPSTLGEYDAWPMMTNGVASGAGVSGGALLAVAGGVPNESSVAAIAGPLTMQLTAPLTFVASSGPLVIASAPLVDDVNALQPQLTPAASATSLASAGASESSHATTTSVAEGEVDEAAQRYRVKAGDSLWRIAHDHDVSVNELRSLNGLRSKRLMPGQVLRLPAASSG